MWGTPPHPPARTLPLQPFPGFRRSDVLACGRPSLVRYYPLTEQVPLKSEHLRPLGSGRFLEFALGWGQTPALHFLLPLSAVNSRFGNLSVWGVAL